MLVLALFLACSLKVADAADPSASADACAPTLVGQFSLTDYPGKGAVGPDGAPAMPISKEYTFTEATYRMEGYPPLTVSGRYAVLQTQEQRLEIAFTDTVFDGQPAEDQTLWVTLSDCGATLVMEGMTYTRVDAAAK